MCTSVEYAPPSSTSITSSCANVNLLCSSALRRAKNFPNKYTKVSTSVFGSLSPKTLFDHKFHPLLQLVVLLASVVYRDLSSSSISFESLMNLEITCIASLEIHTYLHLHFLSNTVVFQRRFGIRCWEDKKCAPSF